MKIPKNEIKKIADDVSKIIIDSKAVFFTTKNEKNPKIPVNELLYELKATISNNVNMYFYKLLK